MATVYIGPNHGEGGAGDASPAGQNGITGVRYGSTKQVLASVVGDLAMVRTLSNALRSDVVELRARVAELITLTTELKQDHNATDTAANAAGAQTSSPVAQALAALVANADADALNTVDVPKPA